MFHHLCKRITACTALSLLAACSSSERQASQTTDSVAAPVEAQAAHETTPGSNTAPSMRAFRDPVTGEFRDPTPEEAAAMRAQGSDSQLKATEPAPPREVKLRNGATSITLENDPQTPLQACTKADGSLVVDHTCEAQEKKQDPKGGKP